MEPTPFHVGFAGSQTATRALDAAALEAEERLREARDTVADEALARSVDAAPPSPEASPEVESLVQSVSDELADAPGDVAAAVRQRLATLQESTVARSPSFYRDLLADLRRGTLRHGLRQRLDAVANAIQKTDVHIDVQAPLARTEALVTRLRESGSDNERHVAEAEVEAQRLLAQSAAHHEEDAVREEEVRFVKSQIVESLSDLGYQVMGDLQVLDLERSADVLLQVPRQGNYVNLRFREDGQFVYNFLIPEDPDDLSRDDRRRKVAEMDSACDAFLGVLQELRDYGLDMDQTAHREASESVLMTVPDRLRDRVQETTSTRKRRHDEAERQRLRLDSPDAR